MSTHLSWALLLERWMFLEQIVYFITQPLLLMIFHHFPNSDIRHKSQAGRLWNLPPLLLPALTQLICPLSGCYLSTSQLNRHPSQSCWIKNDDLYDLFRKRRWYLPLSSLQQVADLCLSLQILMKDYLWEKWSLTLKQRSDTMTGIYISTPQESKGNKRNPRNISGSDNSYSWGNA